MRKLKTAEERMKDILSWLEQTGSVSVNELSEHFGVTKETIRKDLERLEVQGSVLRTHGGAVLQQKDPYDPPIFFRESIHEAEKRAIARHAASIVQEGDIIAVDSGSTCLHMIKQLADMQVTVITYSLPVLNALITKSKVKVIVIGGIFERESLANLGMAAEQMVENYHINKFFFSCKGFDLDRISEPFEAHVLLKRKIASISDQLILLADSSKYGRRSLIEFIPFDQIDDLVTDNHLSNEDLKEIQSMGVQVMSVSP